MTTEIFHNNQSVMISENVKSLLNELPPHVQLVAAAKTRTVEEIREAVDAGIMIIGENYVQEAQTVYDVLGSSVKYHFIGHLQRNKVKHAVKIFNFIETVDSVRLAEEISKRCSAMDKTIDILIEINSGREPQKFGVMPEDVESIIRQIAPLSNIKIKGLMTMGPYGGDPEFSRPYFIETKKIFDRIKSQEIPNVEMMHLSMGMTNSYGIAIEEGATHVRIGTKIFSPRS